jgi:hypothetical protein
MAGFTFHISIFCINFQAEGATEKGPFCKPLQAPMAHRKSWRGEVINHRRLIPAVADHISSSIRNVNA